MRAEGARPRYPIRAIRSGCWARIASGQRIEDAAAPPSGVISSRRRIPSTVVGVPERTANALLLLRAFETELLHQRAPLQPLGFDIGTHLLDGWRVVWD